MSTDFSECLPFLPPQITEAVSDYLTGQVEAHDLRPPFLVFIKSRFDDAELAFN